MTACMLCTCETLLSTVELAYGINKQTRIVLNTGWKHIWKHQISVSFLYNLYSKSIKTMLKGISILTLNENGALRYTLMKLFWIKSGFLYWILVFDSGALHWTGGWSPKSPPIIILYDSYSINMVVLRVVPNLHFCKIFLHVTSLFCILPFSSFLSIRTNIILAIRSNSKHFQVTISLVLIGVDNILWGNI